MHQSKNNPIKLNEVEKEARITNEDQVKKIASAFLNTNNKSELTFCQFPAEHEVELIYHTGEKEMYLIRDRFVRKGEKAYKLRNTKLSLELKELFEK